MYSQTPVVRYNCNIAGRVEVRPLVEDVLVYNTVTCGLQGRSLSERPQDLAGITVQAGAAAEIGRRPRNSWQGGRHVFSTDRASTLTASPFGTGMPLSTPARCRASTVPRQVGLIARPEVA